MECHICRKEIDGKGHIVRIKYIHHTPDEDIISDSPIFGTHPEIQNPIYVDLCKKCSENGSAVEIRFDMLRKEYIVRK